MVTLRKKIAPAKSLELRTDCKINITERRNHRTLHKKCDYCDSKQTNTVFFNNLSINVLENPYEMSFPEIKKKIRESLMLVYADRYVCRSHKCKHAYDNKTNNLLTEQNFEIVEAVSCI